MTLALRRPDFFIVGAPKSGTTAMYEYLSAHPDIFMSPVKEPNYFGSDIERRRTPRISLDEYLALFADARNAKRVGEASVRYLHSTNAAREIAEFNADARAIIMLRYPPDMMYAMHSELLFLGAEDIDDFGEALEAEHDRLQGRRIPAGANKPAALLYRASARYSEQVERYFDALGRQRVLVIIYDDFRRDVAAEYAQTLRFLDVDAAFTPAFRVVNANKQVRSRTITRLVSNPPRVVSAAARRLLPATARRRVFRSALALNASAKERRPMDPNLRRKLRTEFAPEIRRLETLLGRELPEWTS
jgi:hypothetical protein